jgi:UDP-2-acetamido-3-amino-2,3-dideoxy-glucuronate N-acetyltransferase
MRNLIMSKRSIGLIGLGFWGKNLLRNLYEMGVLHTACDSSKKIIQEKCIEFPNVKYSLSADDLVNNSEITAVVIATPAATHHELATKILLAGKDVFVEKPLALTVKDGQSLVSLAKEKGRILMVGHILNYHPAIVKLKEIVSTGELGKVEYIYSNRLNIGKIRTEENILWSFAPHDISILLLLLEDEPVAVSSVGGDYLTKGIYDTTLTSLEFNNGVKGHIFVSWLHPYKEQKLIVVGSKAMAVFDDVSDEKLFVYPHTIRWKNGNIPVAQKAEYRVIPFKKTEPLREELNHFLDCIKFRRNPLTDGKEGLRVLKILEAAEKSLKRNQSEIV